MPYGKYKIYLRDINIKKPKRTKTRENQVIKNKCLLIKSNIDNLEKNMNKDTGQICSGNVNEQNEVAFELNNPKNNIYNESINILEKETNQVLEDDCLEELNDVLKNNHEILSETETAAALLAIFFHLKLTQQAFKVISDFINIMSTTKIPNSFDKCANILLKETRDEILFKKSWFCQTCLRKIQLVNQYQRKCTICKANLSAFYHMSIKNQIQRILNKHYLKLSYKTDLQNLDNISDIIDGDIHRNLLKNKKISSNSFTFLINVDGISLCEKSKNSIWPVILVMIQLPPEIRYCLSNIIIGGISTGSKPIFEHFLVPIVDELNLLEQGCIIRLDNEKRLLNFFVTHGVYDKPARAAILNIKNSNGFFGCLKCQQKGESILTEKGGRIQIYPFKRNNPDGPARTNTNYETDLKYSSNGVKSKTVLSSLSLYQPVLSTNIDYMHSILEGVVKRLFKAWFEEKDDPKFPGKSLKKHIVEINLRIMSIRPPSFIPSAPREIHSWMIWRAREFLVFLLYYCLPVFSHLMEANYFAHLMKLVISMEYLLSKNISRTDLDDVNKILTTFVEECPSLYGDSIMLSGTHELLHIVQCTRDFGPINSVNSFPFEENNRGILSFIHGNDLVGDEFLKVFSVAQALQTFVENYVVNTRLKEFLKKYTDIRTCNNKSKLNIVDLKFSELIDPINNKFEFLINSSKLEFKNIKFTKRVTISGIIYTDDNNKSRFDNSCVELENGDFGFIHKIIVTKEKKVYFLVKRIVKLLDCYFDPVYPMLISKCFICSISNEFFIYNIDCVKKVCFIRINDDLNFISTFNMEHLFH